MVKVASVYKDLICERPAGLCKDIDVQEYATAQTMMQDPCLKLGYAHTLGFYEVGDGGEAYYTVTGDGEYNNLNILKCAKYVATLIPDNIVYPEQVFKIGLGNTNDMITYRKVIP